jgi:hypothetical protein
MSNIQNVLTGLRNAAKDGMFRLMVRKINDYAYQDIDSLL